MKSVIREELEQNTETVCTTQGDSMWPLLSHRRDVVRIRRTQPGQRLRKYEVPLYMREGGNNYVLHRILKVRKDDYVICGDNRWRREYGITDRHIVGVMTGIVRNGKELSLDSFRYKLYVHLWCDLFFVRFFILFGRDCMKRLVRGAKRG